MDYLSARDALHRYALYLMRCYAFPIGREEGMSSADLALSRALVSFDSSRGPSLVAYARPFVRGQVFRLAAAEFRYRESVAAHPRECRGDLDVWQWLRADLHAVLTQLGDDEADVLVRHGVHGESLASISLARGRHRAWGCRMLKRARERAIDLMTCR